jgi:hypothetical protein
LDDSVSDDENSKSEPDYDDESGEEAGIVDVVDSDDEIEVG